VIGRRLLLGTALPLLAGVGRAAAADVSTGDGLTLMVGAAAGSPEDHAARAFAPFLARHMPRTAIRVANRPDNDGLAACHAMLDAPPDGLTLLWGVTPTLLAQCLAGDEAALLDRIGFLAAVRREPVAFVSPAQSTLATARDLLRAADSRGAALPLATPFPGSPAHLAALQLQAIGQTPLAIVAFPSAIAARQAVRAGTACAAALALSDAIDDLRDGRLVGLGITASSRVDAFPDIAPLEDAGLGLSMAVLRGLAGRSDLAAPAAQRLLDALRGIAADPEFRAEADANGFQVAWVDSAAWAAAAGAARDTLSALWPATGRRTLEAASQPG
jgi:tripartite-type tricarboxylate transporter receptor subunit TctC